jgi:hypothetical protein
VCDRESGWRGREGRGEGEEQVTQWTHAGVPPVHVSSLRPAVYRKLPPITLDSHTIPSLYRGGGIFRVCTLQLYRGGGICRVYTLPLYRGGGICRVYTLPLYRGGGICRVYTLPLYRGGGICRVYTLPLYRGGEICRVYTFPPCGETILCTRIIVRLGNVHMYNVWDERDTYLDYFILNSMDTMPHISRHGILANEPCVWLWCCRFGLLDAKLSSPELTLYSSNVTFIYIHCVSGLSHIPAVHSCSVERNRTLHPPDMLGPEGPVESTPSCYTCTGMVGNIESTPSCHTEVEGYLESTSLRYTVGEGSVESTHFCYSGVDGPVESTPSRCNKGAAPLCVSYVDQLGNKIRQFHVRSELIVCMLRA